MKYKVSVITVVYNDAPGLIRTSKSVLNQDFDELEYLIIDGASTDGTRAVLQELVHNDCVRVISEADRGIYDAMNKGILHATGDWLIFMNAGDCFYRNDVLSRVFCREYPEDIGLLGGDVMNVANLSLILHSKAADSQNFSYDYFPCCHQAAFYRRSVHVNYLYKWKDYPICADADAALRMFADDVKYQYLNIVISYFDVSGVSCVNSYDAACEHNKMRPDKAISRKSMFKSYIRQKLYRCALRVFPRKLMQSIMLRKKLKLGWKRLSDEDKRCLSLIE